MTYAYLKYMNKTFNNLQIEAVRRNRLPNCSIVSHRIAIEDASLKPM